MKKISFLILIFTFLFVLTSCKSNSMEKNLDELWNQEKIDTYEALEEEEINKISDEFGEVKEGYYIKNSSYFSEYIYGFREDLFCYVIVFKDEDAATEYAEYAEQGIDSSYHYDYRLDEYIKELPDEFFEENGIEYIESDTSSSKTQKVVQLKNTVIFGDGLCVYIIEDYIK